jgi:hypothetical protein
VYGAPALTDWDGCPPITSDYDKSASSLAMEILHKHTSVEITRSLVRNLKITRDLAEVSYGIGSRRLQHNTNPMEQLHEPFLPPSHIDKIAIEIKGRQLTDCCCHWEVHCDEERKQLFRITYSDCYPERTRQLITPVGTRASDWILYPIDVQAHTGDPNLGYRPPNEVQNDCIVLRQVNSSVYAIIGHARDRGRMLESLDYEITTARLMFRLCFDPEDYLILAATENQLSEQEIAETGVCSKPFSSYAMIADLGEGESYG